jgi:hypothetical protein
MNPKPNYSKNYKYHNMSDTPKSEKVTVPITALDEIKQNLKVNRAQHVSEIFAIYDQLPQILQLFKEENLTEEQAVERLGIAVENIFIQYENTQFPLSLQLLKETRKEQQDNNRIILPH